MKFLSRPIRCWCRTPAKTLLCHLHLVSTRLHRKTFHRKTSSRFREMLPRTLGLPSHDVPRREAAVEELPADDQVPTEILEFFVAEAEEHLQVVTQCLLRLETSPSQEQINRLSRAMHTVKGSAAQVGLHRIAHVAHRVEDLIGRLRDGELQPSAEIIDICLDAVDVLKKFLYRQWANEAEMHAGVQPLLARITRLSAAAAIPGVQERIR